MASKPMKYPPVYDPVPLTFVQRIVKVFWGVFLVPYFFQKEVKNQLQGEEIRVETIVREITVVKRIKQSLESSIYLNLTLGIEHIRDYRLFVASVVNQRTCRYDSSNTEHEDLLEQLWTLTRPNIRRNGGRISMDWQDIGFQGTDPATDFRGAGLLGLQNLVDFARDYPKIAKSIFDAGNLPLALTGLQITALISQWLLDGKLQPHFLSVGSNMKQFGRLYAHIFKSFWETFSNSGAKTIMDFPPVWKRFCSELGYELEFSMGEVRIAVGDDRERLQ